MEGIAGVVHESQTDPADPAHAAEYGRFRRLMTGEANAAIEGALAAGADRVLVNDSHWRMMNLLAEELHPAAELLSGGPKARSMMEGVELGFDAALFVGYHAMAGTGHADSARGRLRAGPDGRHGGAGPGFGANRRPHRQLHPRRLP